MDYASIYRAVILIGGIGLIIGLFLGIAAIVFKVKINEKEQIILDILPGNNCGACGFAGCANLAAAIANGEADVNACPVGGAACAVKIAEVMGTEASDMERMVAYVKCAGDCEKTKTKFDYYGIKECNMAAMVSGGTKSCEYGCLGYGSCVDVCDFDAMKIENGIAIVDKEACSACGKCVKACPRSIIEMIPYKAIQVVQCVSKDKGPVVRANCEVGCIACGICVKNCNYDAIKVTDFCAKIDYSKCVNCGVCVEKCPRGIIFEN